MINIFKKNLITIVENANLSIMVNGISHKYTYFSDIYSRKIHWDIFEFAIEFLELLINIDGIFGNSDQEQQCF